MSKETEKGEPQDKWSTWYKIKGACKAALSVLLFTNPIVAVGVAGALVIADSVQQYRQNTDPSKGIWDRIKDTGLMMLGMKAGTMLPLIGLAAAAAGAGYAAYAGHAHEASASVEGLLIGAAVKTVLIPVAAAALIAEGAYSMATGKDLNVISKGIELVMKIKHGIDHALGRDKQPEVQGPTTAQSVVADIAQVVHKVEKNPVTQELAGKAAQVASQVGDRIVSAEESVKKPVPPKQEASTKRGF